MTHLSTLALETVTGGQSQDPAQCTPSNPTGAAPEQSLTNPRPSRPTQSTVPDPGASMFPPFVTRAPTQADGERMANGIRGIGSLFGF